ncbi:hypothetical protein FGO68_gene270 [Halteria grandinella]|uniref:Uncharacterized protein n=1 Tax=Halteria grandinella TaxID=5974 RepID=A0A8J8NZJ3_HALGN|nr:hypothetical protein FGO68_gene270 [Halteria grandinella]
MSEEDQVRDDQAVHIVREILQVRFPDGFQPGGPQNSQNSAINEGAQGNQSQEAQETMFEVVFHCRCCMGQSRWVGRRQLVTVLGVHESMVKLKEDQAIKERKEAETRRNAEELYEFLGFSDVDWNNLKPTDFQSINFSTQEEEYPTLEELAMMEQLIFEEYQHRVKCLREAFRPSARASSRSKRRHMIDKAAMQSTKDFLPHLGNMPQQLFQAQPTHRENQASSISNTQVSQLHEPMTLFQLTQGSLFHRLNVASQEEDQARSMERHQHYEEDFSREHEGRLREQRVCGSSGAILMAEPRTEIEEEEKEHSQPGYYEGARDDEDMENHAYRGNYENPEMRSPSFHRIPTDKQPRRSGSLSKKLEVYARLSQEKSCFEEVNMQESGFKGVVHIDGQRVKEQLSRSRERVHQNTPSKVSTQVMTRNQLRQIVLKRDSEERALPSEGQGLKKRELKGCLKNKKSPSHAFLEIPEDAIITSLSKPPSKKPALKRTTLQYQDKTDDFDTYPATRSTQPKRQLQHGRDSLELARTRRNCSRRSEGSNNR